MLLMCLEISRTFACHIRGIGGLSKKWIFEWSLTCLTSRSWCSCRGGKRMMSLKYMENIVYHNFRQLDCWFPGVKLMEINSNGCFPGGARNVSVQCQSCHFFRAQPPVHVEYYGLRPPWNIKVSKPRFNCLIPSQHIPSSGVKHSIRGDG